MINTWKEDKKEAKKIFLNTWKHFQRNKVNRLIKQRKNYYKTKESTLIKQRNAFFNARKGFFKHEGRLSLNKEKHSLHWYRNSEGYLKDIKSTKITSLFAHKKLLTI